MLRGAAVGMPSHVRSDFGLRPRAARNRLHPSSLRVRVHFALRPRAAKRSRGRRWPTGRMRGPSR